MIGFFLNFTVLVKERERELGILRAVGGSRIQIIWLVLLESAVAGSISIIIGIAAGVALSFVLTEVINRAFFGWSIPLSLPWEQLVMLPLWVLPIALLAALLPAREASRIPIVDAIGRG
jgi:putative ABC transport system permease protein